MNTNQTISFLTALLSVYVFVRILTAWCRHNNHLTSQEILALKISCLISLIVAATQAFVGLTDSGVNVPILKTGSALYGVGILLWLKTLNKYSATSK